MYYDDDQMLMLSGIQHYMFCPRQWALIHVEQQWGENRLTAEGQLLHQNVDNPAYRQKNGDVITLRSVHINAITHPRYPGYWKPYPIEYKRGHRKPDERDEVQLAAQAICLEEMYNIHIPEAALFYNEIRHREVVAIDEHLRRLTYDLSEAMHHTFDSGYTPKAEERRGCRSCSLINICSPELAKKTSVSYYLKKVLDEETA